MMWHQVLRTAGRRSYCPEVECWRGTVICEYFRVCMRLAVQSLLATVSVSSSTHQTLSRSCSLKATTYHPAIRRRSVFDRVATSALDHHTVTVRGPTHSTLTSTTTVTQRTEIMMVGRDNRKVVTAASLARRCAYKATLLPSATVMTRRYLCCPTSPSTASSRVGGMTSSLTLACTRRLTTVWQH